MVGERLTNIRHCGNIWRFGRWRNAEKVLTNPLSQGWIGFDDHHDLHNCMQERWRLVQTVVTEAAAALSTFICGGGAFFSMIDDDDLLLLLLLCSFFKGNLKCSERSVALYSSHVL